MTFEHAMSDLSCAIGNLERVDPSDIDYSRLRGQASRLNKIIMASMDAKLDALDARHMGADQ